ncbi:MAG TPA: oligopeptide/dipeptide ABC transporter ATP-binding protein, partial [Candidatus Methylomirabilis sp.]|nr:oligopeptide/dipeptide ABC transporter ATP-binding protein [Candidatus Methylomirabilis sp.]
ITNLHKHFQVKDQSAAFRLLSPFSSQKALLRAVDGVSFSIRKGETLGLVGESGCGKSTVARCILRLLEPTEGRIVFEGTDLAGLPEEPLRHLRRDLQMIFQDPMASLNPRLSVRQVLEEPLRLHEKFEAAERGERVLEVLNQVGLDRELLTRFPHELSGGQRQRVNIARGIATRPRFVVLDEPTSALDVSLRAKIVLLLEELKSALSTTYLFISHDLSTVKYLSDRVAVMYLGAIVEIAESRELFRRPLHPYTHALLSAIPIPDPDVKRERIILEGEIPSPTDIPSGCRLRGRCPLARPGCFEEVTLREVGSDHFLACHFP